MFIRRKKKLKLEARLADVEKRLEELEDLHRTKSPEEIVGRKDELGYKEIINEWLNGEEKGKQ
ncbi:MAG: hypothetical protein E7602_08240 [Ruminococcaceae bacterium]|nr:hypothetical protein [Oscillospiraceae bacterium]